MEDAALKIIGLSQDGRGIAEKKPGERVTFVSGALPGETVLVRYTAEKKNFREAVGMDILEKADSYRAPFCPHAMRCGGCPLMRMEYAEQCTWKQRFLTDALSRIGHLDTIPINPLRPSPLLEGYRNRIELAFGLDEELRTVLGMRKRTSHQVLSTPSCAIVSPPMREAIRTVENLARESRLGVYVHPREDNDERRIKRGHKKSQRHAGFLRFCQLRTGYAPVEFEGITKAVPSPEKEKIWVLLVTSRGTATENTVLEKVARDLLDACPSVQAVTHEERHMGDLEHRGDKRLFTLSRQARGESEALLLTPLAGQLYLVDTGDFFQVNSQAADILAGLAREGTSPGDMLDLYSGVGAPGLGCIRDGKLTGLEYSQSSVRMATLNAERFGIRASYTAGDASKKIDRIIARNPFPQVLCDPPRGGVDPAVLGRLLSMAPERITYISCNPATLARDAQKLAAQYELVSVTPVDLFPHSPHIESISIWKRR